MKKKFTKIITLVLTFVLLTCSFSVNASAEEGFSYEFEEHCKALLMFNAADGSVVYSMNADKVLPMASLTKIMTFIVASENIPDIENTVVTVPERINTDLEGSSAGIYAGEELTVLQLLNMMMIPSGDDAALTLHIYYDENVAGVAYDAESEDSPFIKLMNEKAEELGCTDTYFVNAYGLHDGDHHSTARDIAKIVQYAMTLPYFNEIAAATVYKLPATNVYTEEREITSANKMLLKDYEEGKYYYEYANGIKTGGNDEAGYCIAASATFEEETYVVIALGSPMTAEDGTVVEERGEMLDAVELFEWAFAELSRQDICITSDVLSEAPLQYAWGKDTLQLVPAEEVSAILPNDISAEEIETVLEAPDMVETPVTQGTVLGKATFIYNDEVLGEVDLVAAESVDRSFIAHALSVIKNILTSIWFWLIIIVIIAAVYIHLKKEQERRRRMRQRRRRREAAKRQAARAAMGSDSSSGGRAQNYSGHIYRSTVPRYGSGTGSQNYRSTTPRYSSGTGSQSYRSTVPRYGSGTGSQNYRSTAPRYGSGTGSQNYRSTAPRYGSGAGSQSYRSTAPRYGSGAGNQNYRSTTSRYSSGTDRRYNRRER